MNKINHNSSIYERLKHEAKSDEIIRLVRTVGQLCLPFLSKQTQQVQHCLVALQYFLLSILLAKGGQCVDSHLGVGHCYACPVHLF